MKTKEFNQNITIFERIVMFIIVFNIPLIFVLSGYIKNKFSWENVNSLLLVSQAYFIIIILILIFQLILNKPYLALLMGCHQKHNRSFAGDFLGICARCTGILLGMLIIEFISYFEFPRLYLLLGITPLLVDGLIQRFTTYKSNNLRRVVTGIFFGPALILITSYFYLYSGKLITYLAQIVASKV